MALLEGPGAPRAGDPTRFAEAIPHARRMDGSGWAGDCPACRGRQTLTWGRDAAGRAAKISCEHDCALEAILDGARARLKAARARDAAAAVRTVKLGGQDMVCASDAEPEYLLEVPSED